jgi:hypothetical protein
LSLNTNHVAGREFTGKKVSRRYYSEEFLTELRSRADIVSLISEYVKLRKAGRRYVGLCPFHQEKTPSFSVDPDKQLFYCFGCGQGGNVFTFLMKMENLTFQDSVEELARKVGLPLLKQPWILKRRDEAHKRRVSAKRLSLPGNVTGRCFSRRKVYKLSSIWRAGVCPGT